MAPRPSNLETVKLTLEILKRIPRNRSISAPELHTQLLAAGMDRSRRTIERQLESLIDQFDIDCDSSTKPYGYRWKTQSQGLSLPALTAQESLLLTLAHHYLQNLLPATLMTSLDGFFQQARCNLAPYPDSKPETEWLSKVRVVGESQPLLPPVIAPEVFEAVSTALYLNRWLTLDYKNAAGKQAERHVMPLGLAQQGSRLYLVCRYDGYDNERSLAIHRILRAEVSGLGFTRPPEFSLQKYDDDGRFRFGEGQHISLSFSITRSVGQHLLESLLAKDQEVEDHGNYYAIRATVIDCARLDWWLNGFGEHVWDIKKEARRHAPQDPSPA